MIAALRKNCADIDCVLTPLGQGAWKLGVSRKPGLDGRAQAGLSVQDIYRLLDGDASPRV